MNTALQAYYYLESKNLIEARPQSGYYVTYRFNHSMQFQDPTSPSEDFGEDLADDLINKVFVQLAENDDTILFSLGVPSVELLPVSKLKKTITQVLSKNPQAFTNYELIKGNQDLRRQIAHWAYLWDGRVKPDDVVTTTGCINAIAYCLMTLTKPGDTVAVESPCYFGILQLVKSLGLNVIELATHVRTGIDMDNFKKTLARKKVNVCILVSNFNNPISSCVPDENKKEIVNLLEKYNIPLIEDDLYGDLFFGKSRPKTCKTFDESGNVLLCSSISKTLAPGYRVGWIISEKYKNKIIKTKLLHSVSSATITQAITANFLENGRYEHHLRKLRHTLHTNSLMFLRAINEYFPDDTKVSMPQGGFFIWLELNKKYNTSELYDTAMKYNISIAPGRIFSLQNLYTNCLRLNYGMQWSDKVENALKTLGNLLK